MARGSGSRVPIVPRKPKAPAAARIQKDVSKHQHHIAQMPDPQRTGTISFAEKLRQARGWSPRSRRRMKAESLQWQAAIATAEAEKTRTIPRIQPSLAKQSPALGFVAPQASAPHTRSTPPSLVEREPLEMDLDDEELTEDDREEQGNN